MGALQRARVRAARVEEVDDRDLAQQGRARDGLPLRSTSEKSGTVPYTSGRSAFTWRSHPHAATATAVSTSAVTASGKRRKPPRERRPAPAVLRTRTFMCARAR